MDRCQGELADEQLSRKGTELPLAGIASDPGCRLAHLAVGKQHGGRFQLRDACGFGQDAATHGISSGGNFGLDGGQPSGCDARVGIGAGDDAGGLARLFEPGAGLVHQQAAGAAHVGVLVGQV